MCHALSMPRSGDTEGHPEQTGGDSLCSQRFIWAWQFIEQRQRLRYLTTALMARIHCPWAKSEQQTLVERLELPVETGKLY